VRRAKLYYLRERVGKRARVRERRSTGPEEMVQRELLYGPEEEAAAAPDSETGEPEAVASEAVGAPAGEEGANEVEAGGEPEAAGEPAAAETEASAEPEDGEQVEPDAGDDAQDSETATPASE
jgi:hypothetical protein